jgi:hypothetical protein
LKLASPHSQNRHQQHIEDDENYSGIPDDNQHNYDPILKDVYQKFREILGHNLEKFIEDDSTVMNIISQSPQQFFTRIYSSHLRRAVETALTIFAPQKDIANFIFRLGSTTIPQDSSTNAQKINVVPYINETRSALAFGNDKDNEWLGKKHFDETFHSILSHLNTTKINPSDPRLNQSGDIQEWIEKVLIPDIKQYNIPPGSNIAVVCHSHLIKHLYTQICNKNETMPNQKIKNIPNTGILCLPLIVNPATEKYTWVKKCPSQLFYSPPDDLMNNSEFITNRRNFCGKQFESATSNSLGIREKFEYEYETIVAFTSLYSIPAYICRESKNENTMRMTMNGIIYGLL